MSEPVLPSVAKLLIVEADDSLCAAMIKLIKSFYLAYRLVRYLFADDGTISDAFCAQIKSCVVTANPTTTTTT